MDSGQRSKLDAVERVAIVLGKYSDEFEDLEEYPIEKTSFDLTNGKLHTALGVQQTIIGDDGTVTDEAKVEMAKILMKYVLRAKVKAHQLGNATLETELSINASYIEKATKTNAIARAKNMRTLLKTNVDNGILTNVTIADIVLISGKITAYDNIKNTPTTGIETKKATGTDVIPDLFKTNTEAINNIFDLAVSYFTDTNIDIVNELGLAKQLITTGVRHNIVTFTIKDTDTNEGIVGAIITDNSNQKTYATNDEFTARINKHKQGKCSFTVLAPGKPPKTFILKIIRKTDNQFTLKV